MITRRQFLKVLIATCATAAAGSTGRASERSAYQVYLPLVQAPAAAPPEPTEPPLPPTPVPPPDDDLPPILDDAPIVGRATGTAEMAIAWLTPRADPGYTPFDIGVIVQAYRSIGDAAGIDWFLALAQMAHETGHLTSFWSLRPQRNPAGIGVTGEWRSDPPPDPSGWAYNTQRQRWERGISFPTWVDHAIPAHLGRLLAYALTDAQANETQRALIATALAVRPLPSHLRGIAPTIPGLNGRWASPGTTYGQSIIALARRMRYGPASIEGNTGYGSSHKG
ncbi:MAG: glucosaminidase domain-containing protein [Roseiflexus sp.]|uniref:glucosaminidase domain-containing protein n=1 Tax=Roseiflexus sp. TaxID=2562120 RepID=UPI0025D025D7|nr:glucosaminidase domain-containing protein [Roseiflexus sp.]MCL6541407.1 glucosaminidase domain-containing protein [Roseiflexus sp.]